MLIMDDRLNSEVYPSTDNFLCPPNMSCVLSFGYNISLSTTLLPWISVVQGTPAGFFPHTEKEVKCLSN